MINEMAKQLQLVDLLKFVAAIMVVSIHTQPFVNYPLIQNYVFWPIVSLAVPYFLIASSYFFFHKEKCNISKYLYRIGLLYIVWFFINIPILYFDDYGRQGYWHTLRGLLLGQTYSGSWYLCCSIWGVIIAWMFDKFRVGSLWLMILGLILYFVGKVLIYFQSILPVAIYEKSIVFFEWYGVMQVSTFTYFIFVFMGYVIAKREKVRRNGGGNLFMGHPSPVVLYLWMLIGIVITVLELMYNNYYDFPISVVAPLILIPTIFMIILNTKYDIDRSGTIAMRLRKMSILLFFIHGNLLGYYRYFRPVTIQTNSVRFIVILCLSIISAYLLTTDVVAKRCPFIKYLY